MSKKEQDHKLEYRKNNGIYVNSVVVGAWTKGSEGSRIKVVKKSTQRVFEDVHKNLADKLAIEWYEELMNES